METFSLRMLDRIGEIRDRTRHELLATEAILALKHYARYHNLVPIFMGDAVSMDAYTTAIDAAKYMVRMVDIDRLYFPSKIAHDMNITSLKDDIRFIIGTGGGKRAVPFIVDPTGEIYNAIGSMITELRIDMIFIAKPFNLIPKHSPEGNTATMGYTHLFDIEFLEPYAADDVGSSIISKYNNIKRYVSDKDIRKSIETISKEEDKASFVDRNGHRVFLEMPYDILMSDHSKRYPVVGYIPLITTSIV